MSRACAVTVLGACRRKFCAHHPHRTPIIEFRGSQLARLIGPVVYIWRRQHVALYVGMSKRGLGRLALPHEQVKEVRPTDSVEVYPCRTIDEAEKLERRFIRQLRPEINKLWSPDHPEWEHGLRGHGNGRSIPPFRPLLCPRGPRATKGS